MSYELETIEGEVLYFDTEDQRTDYVLSRMIERGMVTVRDVDGQLVARLSDTITGANHEAK